MGFVTIGIFKYKSLFRHKHKIKFQKTPFIHFFFKTWQTWLLINKKKKNTPESYLSLIEQYKCFPGL